VVKHFPLEFFSTGISPSFPLFSSSKESGRRAKGGKIAMVYRNYKEFQAATLRYEKALEAYTRAAAEWYGVGNHAEESNYALGCLGVILILVILWCFAIGNWGVAAGLISIYYIGNRLYNWSNSGDSTRRPRARSRSAPVFNEVKPVYEPLETHASGPRYEARDIETVGEALTLLELNEPVTLRTLKQAYRQNLLDYHPDRVATMGKDLIALAEARTKQINQARAILENHLDDSCDP
jgi:hypothetical protein